jgi:hypothetical protein
MSKLSPPRQKNTGAEDEEEQKQIASIFSVFN